MARLTWSEATNRLYEKGVDQGVLYVGTNPGVPWNGLVSISESPTGAEARPAYIDGYKFRNTASREEFEATIEAYYSPPEFDACDGTKSIAQGLFATQQRRRPFGLSYRTRIGNAVEGTDHGYKIHLIYNALAIPSERSRSTISDSDELMTLSWSISTRPNVFSGIAPTAHLVIDSTKTEANTMAVLETVLYGSSTDISRLPTIEELVQLFNTGTAGNITYEDRLNGYTTLFGTSDEDLLAGYSDLDLLADDLDNGLSALSIDVAPPSSANGYSEEVDVISVSQNNGYTETSNATTAPDLGYATII